MINVRVPERDRLIRFLTDFNGVTDHNKLLALGRNASPGWDALAAGEYVLAYDSDGNESIAYVEARRGSDIFDLRADWDTWIPGDEPKLHIIAAAPVASPVLVPAGIV